MGADFKNKSESYREGYKAFGEDVKHYRNPYDEDEQPNRRAQWLSGWQDHQYEYRSDELRDRLRKAESPLKKKVVVDSSKDDRVCGPCAERDGNVYSVEEALDKMPLPHEDCQNIRCRCVYLTKNVD